LDESLRANRAAHTGVRNRCRLRKGKPQDLPDIGARTSPTEPACDQSRSAIDKHSCTQAGWEEGVDGVALVIDPDRVRSLFGRDRLQEIETLGIHDADDAGLPDRDVSEA
jgi:hypothetical protein